MNRKIISFSILILLIASMVMMAGCSSSEQEQNEEKEYTAVLYFASDEYAETGNEELDRLIRVEDIKFQCEEGRQYYTLVNVALRTVPEGVTGGSTCIDDKITVNDVTLEDGTAIVDLAAGKMSSGSLTEAFVIGQIVESLFASFEEIDKVQFLVDGEQAESLMGHFDVREPFTREMNQ